MAKRKTAEFRTYIRFGQKKRWFEVVVFTAPPSDSPRVSKEGEVVAKFIRAGDAHSFAMDLAKRPAVASTDLIVCR